MDEGRNIFISRDKNKSKNKEVRKRARIRKREIKYSWNKIKEKRWKKFINRNIIREIGAEKESKGIYLGGRKNLPEKSLVVRSNEEKSPGTLWLFMNTAHDKILLLCLIPKL